MKTHFGNCKGVTVAKYYGPVLAVTMAWTDIIQEPDGNYFTRPVERRVTKRVRLNNPRKSEQAVLVEVCATIKLEHPEARLVRYNREEGKAS